MRTPIRPYHDSSASGKQAPSDTEPVHIKMGTRHREGQLTSRGPIRITHFIHSDDATLRRQYIMFWYLLFVVMSINRKRPLVEMLGKLPETKWLR